MSLRIGYLTGRYPAVSHTFVLREAQALRDRGLDVRPFAVWRSAPKDLLSGADLDEAEQTYALLPAHASDWVRGHAAALRAGAGTYAACLRRALRLSQPSPRGVVIGLLWFAEAMVLWDRLRRDNLEHLHVHLNGTAPSVALLATAFARDAGSGCRSWSLTVHGPSEFYDVARERLGEKVRSADAVVCISDFARSQLMGLVDETFWPKLEVVHCGIDTSVFDHPRREPAGDRPLELLCVGRLVAVKGQTVLLEAVSELTERGLDVRVTFVGDGPHRETLELIASELGLSGRVTFAGSIGQDQIGDHYAAADVFCMASFAEGVPVVLMEAMATALPCVATSIMGIPELVDHGRTGYLVRPGRPSLLADAIEALAEPDVREEMGRAGRDKVLAEFTTGDTAGQLEALFRSIAGPEGRQIER